MNTEVRQILDVSSLEVQRKMLSAYIFQLKDIRVQITINLYQGIHTDVIEFRQSHFIKTPAQAGAYITSSSWGENEADALRKAVQTFVSYYDEAVFKGHPPKESWLVKNDYF